ncbi:hypothetical protein TNCV_4419361 [Trichonephila clavipes]|nr:hypothetical protein TNCV_4419361 [Trichonephila clavipes]
MDDMWGMERHCFTLGDAIPSALFCVWGSSHICVSCDSGQDMDAAHLDVDSELKNFDCVEKEGRNAQRIRAHPRRV